MINYKFITTIFKQSILVIVAAFVFSGVANSSSLESMDQSNWFEEIETDKAAYKPGDSVIFSLSFTQAPQSGQVIVLYRHLLDVIDNDTLNLVANEKVEWTWQPPAEDYKGYLAEVYYDNKAEVLDQINIAVDVSSDWGRFPRYGFISKYPVLSDENIESVIANLNRHHINGLQFYDWHYKHHKPLKGTGDNPASSWNDIANRTIYFETVKKYILAAGERNMKTMAYNLLYGAWADAQNDGAQNSWRIYTDADLTKPFMLDFPDSWASDIYMMDTTNPAWQNYLFSQTVQVFKALPFDGWHVDQLGDWGRIWNAAGQEIDLGNSFGPFLVEAKNKLDVPLVMNAVNQYGQSSIAQGPVDFMYTEVWSPNDTYSDLVRVINRNDELCNGKLKTILAAYVNKAKAESPGWFNESSVVFADAVILAAGGAHLELGEHMLGHEYFPNSNLKMSDELQQRLIHYYDFMVAYENLLRDGGSYVSLKINNDNGYQIQSLPRAGKILGFSKEKGNVLVTHLINFTDAKTMDWRDDAAIQTKPDTLRDLKLWFDSSEKISRIWMASPDKNIGSPEELSFTQENGRVSFTLDFLEYWDMLVVEVEEETGVGFLEKVDTPTEFRLGKNYPNPFNPNTTIPFSLKLDGKTRLDVIDVSGRFVDTIVDDYFLSGNYELEWRPDFKLASGTYFYKMTLNNREVQTGTMIYLK